jgi:predicted NUDIX family NTP pyrophosphohydrolase
MARRSAGLLMFRRGAGGLQVLLVHPGGPFWTGKDLGAWSIPKGEYDESEDALAAAVREFNEETGWTATAPFLPLGSIRQRGGKLVSAWAFEGDADPATLVSNTFEMAWPRGGAARSFPEVDRAAWFAPAEAKQRILASQAEFVDELVRIVAP